MIAPVYNYESLSRLQNPVTPLSSRQKQVLIFMFSFFSSHNFYPTQAEILRELGLRGRSAQPYLDALVKKGYVEKISMVKGRNSRITSQGLKYLHDLQETQAELPNLGGDEKESK